NQNRPYSRRTDRSGCRPRRACSATRTRPSRDRDHTSRGSGRCRRVAAAWSPERADFFAARPRSQRGLPRLARTVPLVRFLTMATMSINTQSSGEAKRVGGVVFHKSSRTMNGSTEGFDRLVPEEGQLVSVRDRLFVVTNVVADALAHDRDAVTQNHLVQ